MQAKRDDRRWVANSHAVEGLGRYASEAELRKDRQVSGGCYETCSGCI